MTLVRSGPTGSLAGRAAGVEYPAPAKSLAKVMTSTQPTRSRTGTRAASSVVEAALSTAPSPAHEDELSSALRIAVMRLARRLRQEKTDDETTLTQLSALATLERHGPLTLGDLAAHERVQPPSMSRVVGALVERGMTTRTPHPTDGRQQLVAISDRGAELLAAQRVLRDAWLSTRLAGLSTRERATLTEAAAILDQLVRRDTS